MKTADSFGAIHLVRLATMNFKSGPDILFTQELRPFVKKLASKDHGFRLIGDSPDYAAFDGENRVRRIIESCGALVAVLPFRGDSAVALGR